MDKNKLRVSSVKNIIKNWKHPYFVRNAILYKFLSILYRKNNGFYIFNEPWDNLIILDACRYDFFEEQYNKQKIAGNLKKKISRGCHTISFLKENFKKSKYDDIVYITANPHVDLILKDKFHKIIPVWKDGWNEKERTVLPETVYEYSLDAIAKYPDKKKIIHFMQPHYPYIGYNLKDSSTELFRNAVLNSKKIILKRKLRDNFFSWFNLDIYAMIERKEHYRIYKKNLEIVLLYVNKLLKNLSGKTVVTADHGESLGEFLHFLIPIRFYGHIEKLRTPILTQIPWLTSFSDYKVNNVIIEREKIMNSIESISSQLSNRSKKQ